MFYGLCQCFMDFVCFVDYVDVFLVTLMFYRLCQCCIDYVDDFLLC